MRALAIMVLCCGCMIETGDVFDDPHSVDQIEETDRRDRVENLPCLPEEPEPEQCPATD